MTALDSFEGARYLLGGQLLYLDRVRRTESRAAVHPASCASISISTIQAPAEPPQVIRAETQAPKKIFGTCLGILCLLFDTRLWVMTRHYLERGKENKQLHHKRKENDHKEPTYTCHGKMCQRPFHETYKCEVVHNSKPETKTSGAAAALHGCALQI